MYNKNSAHTPTICKKNYACVSTRGIYNEKKNTHQRRIIPNNNFKINSNIFIKFVRNETNKLNKFKYKSYFLSLN